jgi:hypothetical protein
MPEDWSVDVFEGSGDGSEYVGPWLKSGEYEALCRHALSREYGMPLGSIKTGHLQGPSKVTRHQIDLYWTSQDGVCEFLCIANAKFLKKSVSLTDIMTLLGVQQAVRAQKAMIITNSGYSEACVAQAKENGVALLIVRPAGDFDAGILASEVPLAAAELEKRFGRRITPAYRMGVVHKGFEGTNPSTSLRAGAQRHEGTEGNAGKGVEGVTDGAGGSVDSAPLPSDPVGGLTTGSVESSTGSEEQCARPLSIPNKMMCSLSAPARGGGPFGIRRK